MERKEVYKSIDSERDYQNRMTADPTRPDMVENMSMGDIISAIEFNLERTRSFWYVGSKPHPEAMVFIRKIAGLCVKAGEQFGMPERENK